MIYMSVLKATKYLDLSETIRPDLKDNKNKKYMVSLDRGLIKPRRNNGVFVTSPKESSYLPGTNG